MKKYATVAGVGGFDKGVEDVERSGLYAVTQEEFLYARKFHRRRHQPSEELVVRFQSWASFAGLIAHAYPPRAKNLRPLSSLIRGPRQGPQRYRAAISTRPSTVIIMNGSERKSARPMRP